jgi:ketosteroid isomerase-like protein
MQTNTRTLKAAAIAASVLLAAAPAPKAHAGGTTDSLSGATATVNKFADAVRANDASAVGALLVHDEDAVNFGTDKAERWVGYQATMAAMRAQFAAFQTTSVAVKDQVVHLMPAGDGAYFSELWDWSISSQGQKMVLKDVRVTGVLVRRDDRWQGAQFHFSLPVGGQAVPY